MKQLPIRWKYDRTFAVKKKKGYTAFSVLQNLCYGLVVLESCEVEFKHLNSLLRVLNKFFKKRVQIKFNSNIILPFTKKSISARMGKGKGARKGFKALVSKGSILVEISNISYIEAKLALTQCAIRLPVATKFLYFRI